MSTFCLERVFSAFAASIAFSSSEIHATDLAETLIGGGKTPALTSRHKVDLAMPELSAVSFSLRTAQFGLFRAVLMSS